MPTRTEGIVSKGMGALKRAKATMMGVNGVFKRLAEEHGEVSALLNRVKRSSDVDVRRRLFPTIRAELLAHEQGELREVYPVFRQHGELAAIADHHEKEAGELERLLDRIAALEFTDAAWSRLFDELVQMVTHHTREEENDYFPKASRILGKDESQRILPRYEAAKAAAGRPSITH